MVNRVGCEFDLALVADVECCGGFLALAGGIGDLGMDHIVVQAWPEPLAVQFVEQFVGKRHLELPLGIGVHDGVGHLVVEANHWPVVPPVPVPTALGEFEFDLGIGQGHAAVGGCFACHGDGVTMLEGQLVLWKLDIECRGLVLAHLKVG